LIFKCFSRLKDLISKSKGRILYKSQDENDPKDLYIGPHVIEVEADDALMQDELFGPILPIVLIESLEEAMEFINNREKPLNAYIFSNSEEKIERFMRETYSGNAVSNGVVLNYYSKYSNIGNPTSSNATTFRRSRAIRNRTLSRQIWI
jgi:acyl-CoA reductase-like NAD-dependent aldehyde dehydrogenase